jgi:hypothetical protein
MSAMFIHGDEREIGEAKASRSRNQAQQREQTNASANPAARDDDVDFGHGRSLSSLQILWCLVPMTIPIGSRTMA